jgi:hypothetical protein
VQTTPQSEHNWLHKLVGDWTYEHEAPAQNGRPPEKVTGTESVRSLGGLWVVCEGAGEMPGGAGPARTVMTLGYDPQHGRYVGTFVASMMTYLWVYDGSRSGDVLTLDAEGPSFTEEGKMAAYKDVIEFKSDDHRTLTSHCLDAKGQWNPFMAANYYRKNA